MNNLRDSDTSPSTKYSKSAPSTIMRLCHTKNRAIYSRPKSISWRTQKPKYEALSYMSTKSERSEKMRKSMKKKKTTD